MAQFPDAFTLAQSIQAGHQSATEVLDATLATIAERNADLHCFTHLTLDRARRQARFVDAEIAAGRNPGPLAGVPFAVKNLFDIEGVTTLAGAKLNQANPAATQDATAITRLEQAGAVLVGALNMDEYAYGFVTINEHFGTTPNPHDLGRMAGGSSGGSAAAVAAGLVPLTLGSDTNGSIRVPAALCGVYGLKPTYGRLSRAGAFLFSASLDHVGPLGQSLRDVALAYDAMQGADPRDPVCTQRWAEPVSPELDPDRTKPGMTDLRLARLGGHFDRGMEPAVRDALDLVIAALGITNTVDFPETERARAAAYILTACEGSQLHLERLRRAPMDFDKATRERFLAGALIPATWYTQAQRMRRWYGDRLREILTSVDVLIAPTTPCVAPPLHQTVLNLDGETFPLRPHLGFYTQPLSFAGLPVLSVPLHRPGALPVGIQIIAAPYQEAKIFRVAAALAHQEHGTAQPQQAIDAAGERRFTGSGASSWSASSGAIHG